MIATKYMLTLLSFGCFSCAGIAHEARNVSDLISDSEIILIGEVLEINNPDLNIDPTGIFMYAEIQVHKQIKGTPVASNGRIRLVSSGFSPGNPKGCCSLGSNYLLFLHHGYGILEQDKDGEFFVKTITIDNYHSSIDGSHGLFLVTDGAVQGWPNHESLPSVDLQSVVKEIKTSDGFEQN